MTTADQFVVRIELHALAPGEAGRVYQALHDAMESRKFERVLRTTKGALHLPPGEYIFPRSSDSGTILDFADAAAKEVHNENFAILVTPTTLNTITSRGLDPVAPKK